MHLTSLFFTFIIIIYFFKVLGKILILICFREDGTINLTNLYRIRKELFNAEIRLNSQPPRIVIKERTRGGIRFTYKRNQIMDR